MPALYDLEKHMNGQEEEIGNIIAQQYDLILNGYEIGGGSVRAHKAEILEATYKNMGYNKEEMMRSVGTMYKAFPIWSTPTWRNCMGSRSFNDDFRKESIDQRSDGVPKNRNFRRFII